MKNLKLLLAVSVIAMVTMGCASLFGTQLCPVSGEGLTSRERREKERENELEGADNELHFLQKWTYEITELRY